MFLRYSGCIWKMPCAPHYKQQETKNPRETAKEEH